MRKRSLLLPLASYIAISVVSGCVSSVPPPRPQNPERDIEAETAHDNSLMAFVVCSDLRAREYAERNGTARDMAFVAVSACGSELHDAAQRGEAVSRFLTYTDLHDLYRQHAFEAALARILDIRSRS